MAETPATVTDQALEDALIDAWEYDPVRTRQDADSDDGRRRLLEQARCSVRVFRGLTAARAHIQGAIIDSSDHVADVAPLDLSLVKTTGGNPASPVQELATSCGAAEGNRKSGVTAGETAPYPTLDAALTEKDRNDD